MKVLAIFLAIFGAFHLFFDIQKHRQMLVEKYSPTIFTRISSQDDRELSSLRWRYNEQSNDAEWYNGNYSRQELLANRAEWKLLGSGSEGEAFVYRDTVVKVFRTANAPFRNCVSGVSPELRWPTEISASIMLGGMADGGVMPGNASYIPVVDYFLAPSAKDGSLKWHFLTPFLASGNMRMLSGRLRQSRTNYTARDLDIIFRPSFNQILDALDFMHTKKNLCHDDVRPDNIFLGSAVTGDGKQADPEKTTHWILADMGNVRQPTHVYHSSALWSSLNPNLPDCRENDVFRLVKSYLIFLRSSVDNARAFDQQFFEDRQPWSRLFWQMHDDLEHGRTVSASETKRLSTTMQRATRNGVHNIGQHRASLPEAGNWLLRMLMGQDFMVMRNVASVLRIRAAESVARRWGLVSLLGIPVGECEMEN